MNEVEVMQNYTELVREGAFRQKCLLLHATLVKSCLANLWICVLGNGTNWLDFKKSNTLCPYRSVTMQM